MKADGALKGIENWFQSQCDGDWEHGYGIEIKTLDNPGWAISIDVTKLVPITFSEILIDDDSSEIDWVLCRIDNGSFQGRGDPAKLITMLDTFFDWNENIQK